MHLGAAVITLPALADTLDNSSLEVAAVIGHNQQVLY
jgi:hypothetical protein